MKSLTRIFSIALLLGAFLPFNSAYAQTEQPKKGSKKIETIQFSIYGNCGQCQDRIEETLDRKGILNARWDKKTGKATVKYNSDKVSEDQIHQWVAEVGHDTEKQKATKEAYEQLPDCCKYKDDKAKKH